MCCACWRRSPRDRPSGELCTRSEEFRALWATHDVRLHHTGVKYFHQPVVGDLSLAFEAMPLPADLGLALTAYHAEPGSASHDGLRLLANRAAADSDAHDATAETTAEASPRAGR